MAVRQMLGHKSATMTLDLSGHLLPVRLDVVADGSIALTVFPAVSISRFRLPGNGRRR